MFSLTHSLTDLLLARRIAACYRLWGVYVLEELLQVKLYTINRLTPDDSYMGRTAPLTSKHYILYIYSTNVGTEYFKHALYSPFFSLQNAVCFIMLTCLVPVLFTFYIQGVLKLKKNNSGAKGLIKQQSDYDDLKVQLFIFGKRQVLLTILKLHFDYKFPFRDLRKFGYSYLLCDLNSKFQI